MVDDGISFEDFGLCALVEMIPETAAVHARGPLVHLNPACQQMLDPKRESQLSGKPVADCVHPEDRASLAELMATVERGERPKSARDLRLCRTDGEPVETEMLAVPVHPRGGPAVLAMVRNLAEPKRTQPHAIRADRAVAVLAAGLVHEINDPLSYVIGNLDFLQQEMSRRVGEPCAARDEARIDEETESLNAAEVAGEGFKELLESIEDAREGAHRVRLPVSNLSVLSPDDDPPEREIQFEPLWESVIKMLSGEICARARLVRSDEPVAAVRANPTQLAQVFLDLLATALQALPVLPPGRGEIRVSVRRRGQAAVLVEVRDNRSGSAPELQRRVFDLSATDALPGQRGPGLSACQTLIAEIGGAITLENRVGGKCTFRASSCPRRSRSGHSRGRSRLPPGARPSRGRVSRAIG